MGAPMHTPGPWCFDGTADNHIIWSGPNERIAFMAHSNGSYPERDTANARLIAAAPELLDTVRGLLKDHLVYHNTPEHAAARALLRKIEGAA